MSHCSWCQYDCAEGETMHPECYVKAERRVDIDAMIKPALRKLGIVRPERDNLSYEVARVIEAHLDNRSFDLTVNPSAK